MHGAPRSPVNHTSYRVVKNVARPVLNREVHPKACVCEGAEEFRAEEANVQSHHRRLVKLVPGVDDSIHAEEWSKMYARYKELPHLHTHAHTPAHTRTHAHAHAHKTRTRTHARTHAHTYTTTTTRVVCRVLCEWPWWWSRGSRQPWLLTAKGPRGGGGSDGSGSSCAMNA